MPDDFAAYRDQVANFDEDMPALLADLRELTHEDSWDVYFFVRPHEPGHGYSEVTYWEVAEDRNQIGGPEIPNRGPSQWEYTAFRADMDAFIARLESFVGAGDPTEFDSMVATIDEVIGLLEKAKDFDGMGMVETAIEGWVGGAAANFRNTVLAPFDVIIANQASLAKEIAVAASSYQAIVERARGDVLGVASDVKGAVEDSSGGFDLGRALFLAAAVAAGVASFGTGSAAIAWVAGTAEAVFTGIESAAGGRGGEGDRTIHGKDAANYLISANEQITKILQTADAQEGILRDGIQADLAEAGQGGRLNRIDIPNPDMTSIDSLADLGSSDEEGAPGEFAINSVVRLKAAAVAYLPATAQILHDAQTKLHSVRDMYRAGVGNKHVTGGSSDVFFDLIETLDTAMDRTRDFLYLSGEKLAAAADAYYQTDAQNNDLSRLLSEELDDFNYDILTDAEYERLHP